ncbi:hypothetical protein IMCC3317_08670 [Kordia antarctica]|uniref:Dihydroorotase n=1 Tax=Kordia antarctica TaxID=1218801 RepID=A0A7L4ZGG6_9FLAO|nr:dihydroorotase [Kordia antarctica]QHI35521.1 hypothetical protein IMCC3317_08670 [Kordia antarctica]
MKNTVLATILLIFFSSSIYSQNSNSTIQVGDTFTIGEAYNDNYKHINFPNANFIIKKGGIASYSNIKGEKVEVTSIEEKKDGSLVATIQLTSKRQFFNSHKYVTVVINEAIRNKELMKI